MIVGVDPPPSLAQPGTFEVASGDSGTLPTDARPVLGPQLATATVLDTSAAGAGELQNGINGTTNLLLQLPDGVRNLVVADGGDAPRTLSPLTQGATEAVAALNSARAGGTRHTGAALDAAVAGLPPEAERSRLRAALHRRAGRGWRAGRPAGPAAGPGRRGARGGDHRAGAALLVGGGRGHRRGRRAGHRGRVAAAVRPGRVGAAGPLRAHLPAAVDAAGDRSGVDDGRGPDRRAVGDGAGAVGRDRAAAGRTVRAVPVVVGARRTRAARAPRRRATAGPPAAAHPGWCADCRARAGAGG